MHTCIIFNPAARGQKAERLRALLQGTVGQVHCRPTSRAGEARALAATAVREGFTTVVAAGGDGTVNEVLNGIGDVPGGFAQVRLGVLPMGTVNVFARELKLPLTLPQAWQTIERGAEKLIDLPCAEFMHEGKQVERYFVQLAGAGLDAQAVALVNWELKKMIGPLAYVVAGLKAMGRTQPKITVRSAAGSSVGELVLIGNGRLYGGNFRLFPQANLCDGELDLSIFPKIGWTILLRAGLGLVSNRLHGLCGVERVRVVDAYLTADRQTFFQLDGELVGELPARLSVAREKLRVVVGEKTLESLRLDEN